jgi:hypothetical protein
MQINYSNGNIHRLKETCEFLDSISKKPDAHTRSIDTGTASLNLQYNLSLIIANIFLNLDFPDRSQKAFVNEIDAYNKDHKTSLSYADFHTIGWIRLINNELQVPEGIYLYLLNYKRSLEAKTQFEYFEDSQHATCALFQYFEKHILNDFPTITLNKVESILSKFGNEYIDVAFLKDKYVVEAISEDTFRFKVMNSFIGKLSNEIAALIWLCLKNAPPDERYNRLTKFFTLDPMDSHVWVTDIGKYIGNDDLLIINQYAQQTLSCENDMDSSKWEYAKFIMDQHRLDLRNKIPQIDFSSSNVLDQIIRIELCSDFPRQDYQHQTTRGFYQQIVELLFFSLPKHKFPSQTVIDLSKNTSKPYLTWLLFRRMPESFPRFIPHLLCDSELLPLAFLEIDEIPIDTTTFFPIKDKEHETQSLLSRIWLQFFEVVLDHFLGRPDRRIETGALIATVLRNLADKVLSARQTRRDYRASHEGVKKRYDEATSLLRVVLLNCIQRSPLHAENSYGILFLNSLVSGLKKEIGKTKYRNNFTKLSEGILDLHIEVLKIVEEAAQISTINKEATELLKATHKELTENVMNLVLSFYVNEEVQVEFTNGNQNVIQRVSRGVSEFGLEIIDWGYLFAQMHRHSLLEGFHNQLLSTINLDKETDEYNENNKEMQTKLQLHLKSFLLAYIGISEPQLNRRYEEHLKDDTLSVLRKYISRMSIQYSKNDLKNGSIDIINERLKVFGNDIHYQSMVSLLWRTIRLFPEQDQMQFVESYFKRSVDLRQMLTAVNLLDSSNVYDKVAEYVKSIDMADYLNSVYTITELTETVSESVNSAEHWEIAKTLLVKIKEHYEKRKPNECITILFLNEIELILAYKERDLAKLTSIVLPESGLISGEQRQTFEKQKRFIGTMHLLYNEKQYEKAILELEKLCRLDPSSVKYAYHRYHAKVQRAISVK